MCFNLPIHLCRVVIYFIIIHILFAPFLLLLVYGYNCVYNNYSVCVWVCVCVCVRACVRACVRVCFVTVSLLVCAEVNMHLSTFQY